MAYILGFLFADGNLVKTNRGTYFTSFYTSDKNLLASMKGCLKSDHCISARRSKTGVVYRMQIGSKDLFSDLGDLGLTPNKARRMNLPMVPKKYFGDFLRGFFDGDGNVWSGFLNRSRERPTHAIAVSFTSASVSFLSGLLSSLRGRGIVGGSLYKIKSKNCARLSFSTLDALKIFSIMYTMPYRLFLLRKRLVFDRFIEMRP